MNLDWLTGQGGLTTVLISLISLGILKWIVTKFLSREKTMMLAYKWYSLLYQKILNVDIPVISGDAESKLKETFFSTSGDFMFGGACGAYGIDPLEAMKQIEILFVKRNNIKKLNGK